MLIPIIRTYKPQILLPSACGARDCHNVHLAETCRSATRAILRADADTDVFIVRLTVVSIRKSVM